MNIGAICGKNIGTVVIRTMNKSVVTKFGDGGQTQILFGVEVSKGCQQIETIGNIDELVAWIGKVRSQYDVYEVALLRPIQRALMDIMGFAACPRDVDAIGRYAKATYCVFNTIPSDLELLEDEIKRIESLGQKDWRYPGDAGTNPDLEILVRVARRAERSYWKYKRWALEQGEKCEIFEVCGKYLNRLSDYFYVLAVHLGDKE